MLPTVIIFTAIVVFWWNYRWREADRVYEPNALTRLLGGFARNVSSDLEQNRDQAKTLDINQMINQIIASSTASSTPESGVATSTAL